MPDISAPANAFAVVGLADVVVRLAITSSELYFRYRNASEDVARLLNDLKNLTEIVAEVRAFADKYQQSPYAVDDSEALLPQLGTSLRRCKQELEDLEQVAKNFQSNTNDAWFKQWGKGFSWTLDSQKVLKACRQIESSKVTLNTALSLIGRRNDIVLRHELKATRTDVAGAHACITASSQGIAERVQRATTAIQSSKEDNSASFLKVEQSLASSHVKLGAINVAVDDRAKAINQGLGSIRKNLARSRREQGALARHQRVSSSKVMNRLDNLTQQVAFISLTHTENDEFSFEGENLGMIALPLMLMQTDLFKAVKTLVTEGAIKISPSEARWMEEEFTKLLTHSHEAAALAARSRLSKARTRRNGRVGSAITTPVGFLRSASSESNSRSHNQHQTSMSEFSPLHRFQQRHCIYTAAGTLVIETGVGGGESHTSDQSSSSTLAFRITFLPKLNLSSVGITAAFLKDFGTGIGWKITRSVQAYNIIPNDSEASICARNNDVVGLQKLFAAGKASPYDSDESGWSLLQLAALLGAFEAYMFLLREGANALILLADDFGSGILFCIWVERSHLVRLKQSASQSDEVGLSVQALEGVIENALHMTAAAIERNCDPNMVTIKYKRNMLHELVFFFSDWIECGGLVCDAQISELLSHFIAMGCELEGRDTLGQTPLLHACVYQQYRFIKILADQGADMGALDDDGNGALHLLLLHSLGVEGDKQERLCDALTHALSSGCDPNGLSISWAYSPTGCCTIRDGRWIAWTKALGGVGYTLLDVAEVDEPSTWVVVSKNYYDDHKLPVSSLTLDEWKAEWSRIWNAYKERDNPSTASDDEEDSEESVESSDASPSGDDDDDDDDDEDIEDWDEGSDPLPSDGEADCTSIVQPDEAVPKMRTRKS